MPPAMVWHDDDLAAAIQAGDEDASSVFVQRFQSVIAGIARRNRVPAHDAEDVAQEALADALRQLRSGRFRRSASLSTWLYPIVRGAIANHFRRLPNGEHVAIETVAAGELVSESEFSHEDVLWVRHALERLSPEDQFILRLYIWERMTLEEIGQVLGRQKSAVGDRLKRAKNNFRYALRLGGNPPALKRLRG